LNDDGESGGGNNRRHRRAGFIAWLVYKAVSIFEQYKSEDEHRATQERASNLTANATVAMAAVSVAIFGLGIFQYITLNGQLGEMRAQRLMTIAQLRANLRRDVPQITRLGVDHEPVKTGQPILEFAVSPVLTNSGPTDALDYRGWFDLVPHTYTQKHKVTATDCPPLRAPSPLPPPIVIHAGAPMALLAKNVSVENALGSNKGNAAIFLIGHFEYRDEFPDTPTHHDDWCDLLIANDPTNNIWSPAIIRETAD
jgi:hypothetical protein